MLQNQPVVNPVDHQIELKRGELAENVQALQQYLQDLATEQRAYLLQNSKRMKCRATLYSVLTLGIPHLADLANGAKFEDDGREATPNRRSIVGLVYRLFGQVSFRFTPRGRELNSLEVQLHRQIRQINQSLRDLDHVKQTFQNNEQGDELSLRAGNDLKTFGHLHLISPAIDHLRLQLCEGLEAAHLERIPQHVSRMTVENCYVVGGEQGRPSTRDRQSYPWVLRIGNLTPLEHIRQLSLHAVRLRGLPALPLLEQLLIERCTSSKNQCLTFTRAHLPQSLILRDCNFPIAFAPANDVESALLSLELARCSKVDDNSFANLPDSLRHVALTSLREITGNAVQRLPRDIERLTVDDCVGVDLPVQRVEKLFSKISHCQGLTDGRAHLKAMMRKLEARVRGQPEAMKAAEELFERVTGKTAGKKGPIAVVLLTGPSGVGKTELSKTIATVLGRKFLRFDMNEYTEEFDSRRLLGAPPGYVGYDQGGELVKAIKSHPNAVVLFDEFTKGHPSMSLTLMNLFDQGCLTGGDGTKVDGTKCIFLLTSNLGNKELSSLNWDDKEAINQSLALTDQLLQEKFRPEIIGRITNRVPFRPLDLKTIHRITADKVGLFQGRMKSDHGIRIVVDESVWAPYLKEYNMLYGARKIENDVVHQLEAFLGGKLGGKNPIIRKGDKVSISRVNGQLEYKLSTS